MSKTRYTIVAIYDCPITDFNSSEVHNVKNACKASKSCENCRYGDTKEQLIKKVAQALYKDGLKLAKGIEVDKKTLKQLWKSQYKLAKEIVEFLGVEE